MPRCSLSSWSFGTSALREQSCRQFTRAAPRPLMGRFVQQSHITYIHAFEGWLCLAIILAIK
ncbi:hypothetical protein, partial [Massilia oculi]|uniref:hypothetical protein n=1 Tax=Massilia oculi TaxID=945844 RepID=UPI001AAF3506